ncbi:hypothetical protein, partial [Hyalangium versicolor]|uniref:hypothetical protein n=1 Tax=Hyalangium versicolor TaxID=2861190 RepID=UPI001CCF654E
MKMGMVVVVASLLATAAGAQTVLPCSSGCPARYYFETQPCSSGLCARSWAPIPSEFTATTPKGMSLSTPYEGASLEICAELGQSLTGTGTLRVWTWYPWNRS